MDITTRFQIVFLCAASVAAAPPLRTDRHMIAELGGPNTRAEVAFSPDGKWLLATGGEEGAKFASVVTKWDVRTGKALARFPFQRDIPVFKLAVSPSGKAFAACNSDGKVFVCDSTTGKIRCSYKQSENNDWSEMTPIAAITPVRNLADRAPAYGMHGVTVDGNDPQSVAEAVGNAAERARSGAGPSFLECKTVRLMAHYQADVEHYRDRVERETSALRDPLPRLRQRLLDEGLVDEPSLVELEEAVANEVLVASKHALAEPPPDAATAAAHVFFPTRAEPASPLAAGLATTMTVAAALNEALRRELEETPEVILFGEDIAIPGGVFGITRRLHKEFGGERVFDTPIAESAILGAALGAAQEGLRPIVEIMYSDFLLVALDQLVNQAANVRYLSSGRRSAPLVVRCQQGATPGSCAQHSQSLEALLAHIPGLKVGMASNPHDAYAMLRAAVHDPDPVVVIESRALYAVEGLVHLDAPRESVGGARLRRAGIDALIVTWGRMVNEAEAAAEELAEIGIDAAVLDLRWLSPLDETTLIDLAMTVKRVLVVHEANLTGGFGAEVAARVAEKAFTELVAPVKRLAAPDIRMPAAPALQAALLPSRSTIAGAVRELVGA